MVYTLEKLQTYVRSIDNRIKDERLYPVEWVNERIEEGMAIAQDNYPIFTTTEEYDITDDIQVQELEEVELILQEEVHSVHDVEFDEHAFTCTIMPNNHIRIARIPDTKVESYVVKVRYFFYPLLPFEEIEMSMAMYKLVKLGIAVNVFQKLFDEPKEQYYQGLMDKTPIKTAFDIEKDLLEIPEDRFANGSWV